MQDWKKGTSGKVGCMGLQFVIEGGKHDNRHQDPIPNTCQIFRHPKREQGVSERKEIVAKHTSEKLKELVLERIVAAKRLEQPFRQERGWVRGKSIKKGVISPTYRYRKSSCLPRAMVHFYPKFTEWNKQRNSVPCSILCSVAFPTFVWE